MFSHTPSSPHRETADAATLFSPSQREPQRAFTNAHRRLPSFNPLCPFRDGRSFFLHAQVANQPNLLTMLSTQDRQVSNLEHARWRVAFRQSIYDAHLAALNKGDEWMRK